MKSITAWLSVAWIGSISIAAIMASWLPLQDPANMDLLNQVRLPSREHWLGTDAYGRDMLSRLVFGARVSLIVGMTVPLIGAIIGGGLGVLAGYYRGRIEQVIVVLMDSLLAFPGLLLAMVIVTYFGQSLINVILALGVLAIPVFTRITRINTITITQYEFVSASWALGEVNRRIITRHILPNIAPHVVTFGLIAAAMMIVAEGALSFLGLSVPQPVPSWGGMIAAGREYLEYEPHITLLPAAAMFITVLSLNLLGDRLRTRVHATEI